jgi:hypothetical protein
LTLVPEPPQPLRAWFAASASWPDAVLPAYDGGSVANIAASIYRALAPTGAPLPFPVPPLSESLLDPWLLHDARVIVLLVLDGYGAADWDASPAGWIPQEVARQQAATITSVFPSTTTAALTSIQTGAAPAHHGLVGYTLYIPGLRRTANLLTFQPVDGGGFDAQCLDPHTFRSVPTLYDRLAEVGIESVVVSHRDYARSPLTILQSGDTPYIGHRTLGEMTALLLEQIRKPGRRFVFGYWAGVDMLAHTHGPLSAACDAERNLVDRALRCWLLAPLAKLRDEVAVVVTADHGVESIPPERARSLNELTADVGGWLRPNTGERRSMGLSLRPGVNPDIIQSFVGNDGCVLNVGEAVQAGLYGPPPQHPEIEERVGNQLLLARGQASFAFAPPRTSTEPSYGAHGSLTPREMLAPLLTWRFGR